MTLQLSLTCGPYDRCRALIDGTVKPRDIDLSITVNADDIDRQARARAGEFDVVEFYTGTYIADLARRQLGFTAVPIFVKRMFRHSYIYVNRQAGIRTPTDLHGRRVGLQQWFTTAALWVRGILADDHGVDLARIRWLAERQTGYPDWQPPAWLDLEILPPGTSMHALLAEGALDAAITTETWAPDGHPDIDFLFPNYSALERDYYRRTGFFPIMHTLLIRTAILEAHPWVAMAMYDAWQASKQRCYEWLAWQRIHQTALWYRALWEEERAAAGPDPYLWGFQRTRPEVDKMLDYAYRLGLTARRHAPEELFHPSTLST